MAKIAATNVTVAIANRHKERVPGTLRKCLADITFGNGTLEYPTGGVPLPAKEQFGFKREISFGEIEQPPANGFLYKFDRANHKVKIFTMGFVTHATGASVFNTAVTHYYLTNSIAGLSGDLMIAGASAASTTYDIGPLIELPTTIAPASVTLRVKFEGE